jgi:ATP-dependent RNA helicase DeaD
VIVGTPGRVLDHLGAGRMKLGHVKILVLDEADEMLSLGFWPDMREVHSYLPRKRSSYLFSATMPEKVRSLARYFLHEEQFVTLSEGQVAPQEIEHFFYVCTAQEKESVLARVIEYEQPESAIIFCNTKADVRYVTSFLQRRQLDADQISGDLTQAAREQAIARIKKGQLRFLVATDVAARGLDISDLSHVISYAAPESPEVYVHRTGRTGRAGKRGIAISLVSGLDIGNFKHLENVTKISIQERKPPTEKDIAKQGRERLGTKVEAGLGHLSAAQRDLHVDRVAPMVDELAKTPEGRRDLASAVAAFLAGPRPETSGEPVEEATPPAPDPAAERDPRESRRGGGGRSGGRRRSGRSRGRGGNRGS